MSQLGSHINSRVSQADAITSHETVNSIDCTGVFAWLFPGDALYGYYCVILLGVCKAPGFWFATNPLYQPYHIYHYCHCQPILGPPPGSPHISTMFLQLIIVRYSAGDHTRVTHSLVKVEQVPPYLVDISDPLNLYQKLYGYDAGSRGVAHQDLG